MLRRLRTGLLGPLVMLLLLWWPLVAAAAGPVLPSSISLGDSPRLDPAGRNIFVLIGYLDVLQDEAPAFHHLVDLIFARDLTQHVSRLLASAGYKQDRFGLWHLFTHPTSNTVYHLFNVNELCPSDRLDASTGFVRRPTFAICAAQRERTDLALKLLEHDVKAFDEFIYIGHSRKGRGLAAGPFTELTTFSLFPREGRAGAEAWWGGRLTSVKLFSCASEAYYGARLRALGLKFRGFDETLSWSIHENENTLAQALDRFFLDTSTL